MANLKKTPQFTRLRVGLVCGIYSFFQETDMPRLPSDPQNGDLKISGPKGRFRSTLSVIRSPQSFFAQSVATYGDPFLLTAMNGPVVVTGKPEYVEQIFRAPPDTFRVFASEAMLRKPSDERSHPSTKRHPEQRMRRE